MRAKNEERLNCVYNFILNYQKSTGKSPTYREIGASCGINSLGSVSLAVKELELRKMLDFSGGWNKIKVKPEFCAGQTQAVSIIGECRCGEPALAYENILSTVYLPIEIFGAGEHFMLRAKGRSMIERGIFDGDLMVVRVASRAENGQVVIARVNNDEATAKVLSIKNGCTYLSPANSEKDENGENIYKDIYPQGEWDIIGVVEKVIHSPDKKEF